MKKVITVHMILRLLPAVILGALLCYERFSHTPDGLFFRICCYLVATAVLYLMYPLSRDDGSVSLRTVGAVSLYYLAACFVPGGRELTAYLFLIPSLGLTVAYGCACAFRKYDEPATVFRKDAAWCCAEEDSRTFYSYIVILLASALMILQYEGADAGTYGYLALMLAALDAFLYWKVRSGRTGFINRKKERRIQTIMMTHGHYADVIPEVESSILAKAYNRIEQLMRDHKPYLDEHFTLEKMSDMLRLNKVYISRAVNKYTNKNFRQYVNWHRVLYSVELMKADPWLKVIELAFMSGFHSQVTYNLCFKMFMDQTPSDMLARLRLTNPRPEVSMIKVDLPENAVPPSARDE